MDFRSAVPESPNSVISCITTVEDCGLPNGTIFSKSLTIVNVLHTFQRVKCYIFHCNFAFSSIQIVQIFKIICFVSA